MEVFELWDLSENFALFSAYCARTTEFELLVASILVRETVKVGIYHRNLLNLILEKITRRIFVGG